MDRSGFLQGNAVLFDRKGLGPLRNGCTVEGRAYVLDSVHVNSLGGEYYVTNCRINVCLVVGGDVFVSTHTMMVVVIYVWAFNFLLPLAQ